MSEQESELAGPDFGKGVPLAALVEGSPLLGHARGEPVILVRRGEELFAVGALCTHYGGPLAEGLLVNDTIRCPWHHACFSLRSGEALRAPALNPVPCWRVEQRDGNAHVGARIESAPAPASAAPYRGEIGGWTSRPPTGSASPAIFSRIRSIACTGSSPFGQTSAQFMMVRQRNSR